MKRSYSVEENQRNKRTKNSFIDNSVTKQDQQILELGEDILLEITSHLDAVSITYFLSTSKQLRNLLRKESVIDRVVPYQRPIQIRHWNNGLIKAASKCNIPQVQ